MARVLLTTHDQISVNNASRVVSMRDLGDVAVALALADWCHRPGACARGWRVISCAISMQINSGAR